MRKQAYTVALLVLLCGCAHTQRPEEIAVGMSLHEVIELKGMRFRPLFGPRVGYDTMVYDDVTVLIKLHSEELVHIAGKVVKIGRTTPEIAEQVKNTPYADEMERSSEQGCSTVSSEGAPSEEP